MMLSRKLSIEDKLLKLLLEPKYRYKGVPVSMLGLPILFSCKTQSVANALYRLQKQGYIRRKGTDSIMLYRNKRSAVESRLTRLELFSRPVVRNQLNDLLVIFDIPEDRKAEREWFRLHLKQFGYNMIQRSVWLGPSPLPKEFILYLQTIGLKKCIKTFKLAKNQRKELHH